jgi:hypothetical protein
MDVFMNVITKRASTLVKLGFLSVAASVPLWIAYAVR